MKKYYNVQGSMSDVPNIEVNMDTVYIRENIKKIETEDFTGWEYDETQMTIREHQELTGQKTDVLTIDVETVANLVVVSLDDLQTTANMLVTALEEIEALKGGNA